MDILTVVLAIIVVCFTFIVGGYLFAISTHGVFKKMGVPGPEPGFLGIVPDYSKEGVHGLDMRLVREYGRVVGVFHGRIPSLLVSDPAILKHVFVKDFSNFVNRASYGPVPKIVMDCISEIYDEHWKFMRCVLSPVFSTGKLKQMMPLIEQCTDRLVRNVGRHMEEKKSIELKTLMGCFTMDVIANTGFSIDLDSQSDPDNIFHKYCKKAMAIKFPIIFLLSLIFPFTKTILEKVDYTVLMTDKDKSQFHSIVKQVIQDRMTDQDSKQRDILQMMLNAHKDEEADDDDEDGEDTATELDFKYYKKRGLTKYEIFCNSNIFLLAGYDTSSNGLTFTLYLLATHQDVQEKLHQEIVQHIGQKKPTYSEVMKLQYLSNVFQETLRLYPPAVRLTRKAAESTTICGHHIPAGMAINIPVYAIHHDPELWPDPETFDPDRFLPENKSDLHDYKWIPFGAGPRNCLGMRLALLEAKMALVSLLQNFRFVVTPETEIPVKLDGGAFTRPLNPLYVGVERW